MERIVLSPHFSDRQWLQIGGVCTWRWASRLRGRTNATSSSQAMAFVSALPTSSPSGWVQRSHTVKHPTRSVRQTAQGRPLVRMDQSPSTPPPPPPPPSQGEESSTARCVASAASSAPNLSEALADAAARALAGLVPGESVDVALVFVSARYAVSKAGPSGRESLADVAPRLRAFLPGLKTVFGCTSDGVLGDGREFENVPAVSLTLLRLPGVKCSSFHVMPDDLPSPDATQEEWRRLFGNVVADDQPPAFLLLSDPTFSERGDLKRCLAGLDYAYPGSSVVGSVASAGAGFAKGHMLCTLPRDILGATVSPALRDSGVVGLALSGDVEVDYVVSQGCRALGPTFEVRKVGPNGHSILEMDQVGRPSGSLLSALGHLKSLIKYSTPTERMLLETSLHLGFSPSDFDDKVNDDDFLVRHVVSIDEDTGGVTLACRVRPGQRFRFVVQEESAARQLLNATLQRFKKAELAKSLVGYSSSTLGALCFLDAGRGTKLFREPTYETREIASVAPTVQIAGFFGAGQIASARKGEPAVLHNASSVVAFIRKRSSLSPVDPPTTPTP